MEFITSFLYPKERQPQLDLQTIDLIEDTSFFGKHKISYNMFLDAYERVNPELPLTVLLKTHGGYVSDFLPIARILANHKDTTIRVDRYAFSGGTILCLVCDKIEISKYTLFGGINPYMVIPINTEHIERGKEAINASWIKVIFEYFADMEKTVLDQIKEMMSKKYTKEEVDELINFFTYKFNHNVPISYDELPELLKKKILII